jgi:hypothetical protein
MTSLELAETFTCPQLHATITRGSCAARHRSFAGKGHHKRRDVRNPNSAEGITGCCCRTCDVGAMHARGERAPDVPLARVVAKRSEFHRRPRVCLGCGLPLPPPAVPRSDRMFDIQRRVCGPTCAGLASEFKRSIERLQLPEWA